MRLLARSNLFSDNVWLPLRYYSKFSYSLVFRLAHHRNRHHISNYLLNRLVVDNSLVLKGDNLFQEAQKSSNLMAHLGIVSMHLLAGRQIMQLLLLRIWEYTHLLLVAELLE